MSYERDHTRGEPAGQARAERAMREVCGPIGTISGFVLLLLLAALIPA